MTKKIRKILIANRGEIACRIMRTCLDLDIASVAVYSEVDRFAIHTMMADEIYPIGPAPSSESYLRIENILEAAKITGADAIHPGYGFLAENAKFAEACEKAGLIFIGPKPKAIRDMGSKSKAKTIMEKAGVPVVPGYHGANQDEAFLAREADKIGYPLLIKAVAGGGGKGMRKVSSAKEFKDALKGAKREAKASFSNDHVLLEKYIETPRHIEVQIFGDTKGNAVHLFERDCSIQRRHQKIIEEAPAPGMTEALRESLTSAAVAAAKAIDYQGAGTIEFIVDASKPLHDDTDFYFMEMNTRLQVEHPVTEMVTGIDLVALQILVAEGKPLPFQQKDIELSGHAIEARLYAEDPAANFLPQTGRLEWFQIPREVEDFRFDSGYGVDDKVSVFYDPMIAKLITWGQDRSTAIYRMANVINAMEIAGIKTNLPFLGTVLNTEAFQAGDLSTHFIEEHEGQLSPAPLGSERDLLLVGALAYLTDRKFEQDQGRKGNDVYTPWLGGGWRMNHAYEEELKFDINGDHFDVIARPVGETGIWNFIFEDNDLAAGYLDESQYPIPATHIDDDQGSRIYSLSTYINDNSIYVMGGGQTVELKIRDLAHASEAEAHGLGSVKTPMPGKILEVLVKNGDKVEKDAPLVIMEAMKMEYTLKSPKPGTVKGLDLKPGQQVTEGLTLLEIEE